MSELENKLGSLLADPQIMEKVRSMADSLGLSGKNASGAPNGSSLQALAGALGSPGLNPDQQRLLRALSPYLSRPRLQRLEKAMAAAGAASAARNLWGR